jgi:hypothetical protein
MGKVETALVGWRGYAPFTVIPYFAVPKFTNIYGKRGISVNLPRLFEVGLPGTKAGVEFNTFKEPVAPQLRA